MAIDLELAPVSQPTLSHHLKTLRDAGIVDS
jgi:DNA-binding transcriptional ArsR family regulator